MILLAALVCLFLFSVFKLSKQLRSLFSKKVEETLRRTTKKPILAVVAGLVSTVLVQSSSLITVLTITLVEAQVLPFLAALGIIIGSNIGTTITAGLAALDLTLLAPLTLLAGFLLQFTPAVKKYSKAIFYLGMLLLVLNMMSDTAQIIAKESWVQSFIIYFNNPYAGIIAGMLLTFVISSSSAMTVLSIILASQGVITVEQGFGVILGANIGTTLTALLASLPLGRTAQSVAIGHIIFNILGVIAILPLLPFFSQWIIFFGTDPASQLTWSNIFFNIVTACVATLAIKRFEQLVKYVMRYLPHIKVPEKIG